MSDLPLAYLIAELERRTRAEVLTSSASLDQSIELPASELLAVLSAARASLTAPSVKALPDWPGLWVRYEAGVAVLVNWELYKRVGLNDVAHRDDLAFLGPLPLDLCGQRKEEP